jgi:proteasome assembly chaperone (PAC2) family protein
MPHPALSTESLPSLPGSTLLVALTGWMDGGDVSTGTVKQLMEGRATREIARIDPGGFYIDNFPGSMEIAAIFRPEVKYKNGLITRYILPENVFHADDAGKMLFFLGREPNIDWVGFGKCIFDVVDAVGCSRIIFMGSFGGTVPHTREPRMFGSVSSKKLQPMLKKYRMSPSDYEGPASFASYLLYLAPRHGVDMISIAAEIPGYLQGHNPLSIAAVARRLGAMLDVEVDLESLRRASTAWELQVTEAVEKDEELQERVKKLEEVYDNELIEDEVE